MSVQELKERYVYAVSRLLPHKMRSDISAELDTLIEDMLEERCRDRPAEEKDLRVILAELGSPSGITIVMDNWQKTKFFYEYLLDAAGWLGSMIMGLVFAFGFVTLLFAFFQRKGISLEEINGSWENLPPVPEKQERISKGETIAGICLSIAFLIVFLVIPRILCVIVDQGGQKVSIPLLDTRVVRSVWFLLVGVVIFGVGRDLFGYFEGRYTRRLAVVTGIADILGFITRLITGFPGVFLLVIALIMILDFGTTLYKALKYDRNGC